MYFRKKSSAGSDFSSARKTGKKKWLKVLIIVVVIFVLVGGAAAWRTGKLLSKISINANLWGSVAHMIPGVNNEVKGEKDGRINVLLLAMRGASDPNGGMLTDSSMIVSLDLKDNKISYISLPRDLWVTDVESGDSSKLNAVYEQGVAKGGVPQGIADAEKKFGEIAGVTIDYTIVGNYQAFTDAINAIGGVPVNLSKPFEENAQFDQMGVCDSTTFTKPTGQYQNKIKSKHMTKTATGQSYEVTVKVPMYPLCYNTNPECHGDFKLPAGPQTLNAADALCFVRSRDNSSDFDRAKRQQMVIEALKSKALSIGTLTDFNKVNALMDSVGNNVSTDMQSWEMKRLYDIYMGIEKNNPAVINRVVEATTDSSSILTPNTDDPKKGYILLPTSGNYDQIHEIVLNTFTDPPQKDINEIQ